MPFCTFLLLYRYTELKILKSRIASILSECVTWIFYSAFGRNYANRLLTARAEDNGQQPASQSASGRASYIVKSWRAAPHLRAGSFSLFDERPIKRLRPQQPIQSEPASEREIDIPDNQDSIVFHPSKPERERENRTTHVELCMLGARIYIYT